MNYMLDSNICIYVMNNHPKIVVDMFHQLTIDEVCISTITHGELIFGAENSQRRDQNLEKVDIFCNLITVLPLDNSASRHYGRIRSYLNKNGTPIGNNDLWIAAHALSEDLILVTNNEREFNRVKDLKIENWVS